MSNQFKAGDKVKCVDPGNGNELTKNKVYTVLDCENQWTHVVTDSGMTRLRFTNRFELAEPPKPERFIITTSQNKEYDSLEAAVDDAKKYNKEDGKRVHRIMKIVAEVSQPVPESVVTYL